MAILAWGMLEEPIRQPSPFIEELSTPTDPAVVERRQRFDQIIDHIRAIHSKLNNWEQSHPLIQALTGRNAVVDINNVFGHGFRLLKDYDVTELTVDNEKQFDYLLNGLNDILELIAGQMPQQIAAEPTKITMQDPDDFAIEFHHLIDDLYGRVIQRTKFDAERFDLVMLMLGKLYEYWNHFHRKL